MALLNGRLPTTMLATIPGTSRRVRADVLAQTIALRDAFAAHFGKPLVITDAYRDYDEQVRTKAAKGVYAATPGFSVHGWGLALDLGSGVNTSFTSPEHEWMLDHAFTFGYYHPTWAHDHKPSNGQDEPWHWETRGAVPVADYTVTVPTVTTPTPTGDLPAPLTPEDDDTMRPHLMYHPRDTIALVRPMTGEVQILHRADEPAALIAAGMVDPDATVDLRPTGSTLIWDLVVGVAQRAGKYTA